MPITFVPSTSLLSTLNGVSQAPGFANALSKGLFTGINLAGRCLAPSVTLLTDIWGYPSIAAGQLMRVNPSAAFTPAIVSDSVNDVYTTGASGGTCSFATNQMTVVAAPTTGAYAVGQTVVAGGVAPGTTIIAGTSSPYTLSTSPGTIGTESVATTATGATQINLYFLDVLYNQYVAAYNMNGQTAVTAPTAVSSILPNGALVSAPLTTIATVFRIQGMEIAAAGANASNVGNVYCTTSANTYAAGVPVTTSTVYSFMYAGDNVSTCADLTVPNNYVAMIASFSWGAVGSATFTGGRYRVSATTGANGVYRGFDMPLSASLVTLVPEIKPIFPAQTDMHAQCLPNVATEVTCNNLALIWPLS